ncbi:MAG TPA: glycogen/starch synthase [Chthoniobacterales bacterium]|jgi:starch synthase|nr:glycogen/starch synthase [Chthoniobacterales bacterium]
MRILMISAEGPPLARATALVDVLEALPRELRARKHEVGIAMPFYREISENLAVDLRDTGITVDVPLGPKNYVAEFVEGRTAGGVQTFFVRCDAFFDRASIYGEHGVSYEDNAARFIFFAKAALEMARRMTPTPEILHCHDWAAAPVPVLVADQRLPFSTVLTIHHLAEQGSFWGLDFALTNLPERYFKPTGVEYFGRLNLLKGGILFADKVTTVSERYRREMLTAEGGSGLDPFLREHAHRLISILNGADYKRWNPETDDLLPRQFGPRNLEGKRVCRDLLLDELGLAAAPRGPVFGMVTRLVPEKGFDLLMPLLDRLLSDDVRLIILGEGDAGYETALAIAARKYPAKFAYRNHYDERLAHLIEAGMDIALIPSKIEPSGISAMYSLKYGALPVARATGGIQEIIEDYDPSMDSGFGFLCYETTPDAFWDSIKRAREVFHDQSTWTTLMERAMARDFSWAEAAENYESLYTELARPAGASVAA